MRQETLPSPGQLSQGITLRNVAALAISAVEINAGIPANGGTSSYAKSLSDFFTACAAAVAGFIDAVLPTQTARTIAANEASTVRIKIDKGLDPRFVPAPAAFALTTPTKVISKVEIDGPYVVLTVTVPYTVADTAAKVAYTQPGAGSNLRDFSGNYLASWLAAAGAITNSVPA